MLVRCGYVAAALLALLHAVVVLVGAITPPNGPIKVPVRNGRCIYRGRSVWEAYITLADGKCLKARCKPKERLLHFIPMKECMLPAAGRGCFYEDGLLEQQCCRPTTICY
ncbi:uncharacterized protein LOC142577758 isoform X1 [Dermacentor variabilis]|uniref:uncharacterized protein LOC142577758 isoform X1 n=1 Tax=Dermacentor variabilis TaxID=34621 RepID=UPI003F5C425F